jgi:hypothetical protein
MLIPSSTAVMQLPSLYLKVKKTGRISKAYEAHPDGIHLRLEYDLRAYTLDDLEPVTEQDYQNQIERIKSARTKEEYKEIFKGLNKVYE